MENTKISKVSKEELAQVRQNSNTPTVANFSAEQKSNAPYSNHFIKQLKLSDVEKFFEKFNLVYCIKCPDEQNPVFILAACENFNVMFSDFNFAFDFGGPIEKYYVSDKPKSTKFDMEKFVKYCDDTEQTPEQVITELMVIDLFGKFSSYAPRRREFKQKENTNAFNALPREMQKSLKTAHEKKQQSIDATYNKKYFGDYNASSND